MSSAAAKPETVQWTLNKNEVSRFLEAARDFDIKIVNAPRRRIVKWPTHVTVVKPVNQQEYMDFAYQVRLHHQSDS